MIQPDGTGDRTLWSHGIDDPNEVYEVWSLMWSPDSRRLAFASTHENWCSINDSDVFAVAADGTRYRRVTQAPACAELAAFPSGEVRLPVTFNPILGGSFFGFVYLQGAPEVKQVSLSDGGSSEIVFEHVADFGDDFLQIPSVIDGSGRDYALGSVVDVVAGTSVTAPSLRLFDPAVNWEPRSPTWRADGSMLAYAYGFNSLFEIAAEPTPVDYGVSLLAEGTRAAADVALHLAWGPTAETADQLLYQGSLFDGSEGIWLTTRGAATEAAPLVTYDVFSTINGIAWLPDGSGFVYTLTKGDLLSTESACVIAQHGLTDGTARTVVELDNEYCGLVSVSGDSERLVFERASEVDVTRTELIEPDLWTVGIDGSDPRLLVEDARAPAWSW